MTGRCQSFNCASSVQPVSAIFHSLYCDRYNALFVGAGLVPVAKVLSRELSIPLHAVTKCGPGTEIAVGPKDSKLTQESAGTEPAPEGVGVTAVREHYRVVVVGAVRVSLSLCLTVPLSLCLSASLSLSLTLSLSPGPRGSRRSLRSDQTRSASRVYFSGGSCT